MPDEQELVEVTVDGLATMLVNSITTITKKAEWIGFCRHAGLQHEREVHDRALDEAIDRLTNLRLEGQL